jgi:hypothetical protein
MNKQFINSRFNSVFRDAVVEMVLFFDKFIFPKVEYKEAKEERDTLRKSLEDNQKKYQALENNMKNQ